MNTYGKLCAKRKAFTLIELLIILVTITVAGAIVIPVLL